MHIYFFYTLSSPHSNVIRENAWSNSENIHSFVPSFLQLAHCTNRSLSNYASETENLQHCTVLMLLAFVRHIVLITDKSPPEVDRQEISAHRVRCCTCYSRTAPAGVNRNSLPGDDGWESSRGVMASKLKKEQQQQQRKSKNFRLTDNLLTGRGAEMGEGVKQRGAADMVCEL